MINGYKNFRNYIKSKSAKNILLEKDKEVIAKFKENLPSYLMNEEYKSNSLENNKINSPEQKEEIEISDEILEKICSEEKIKSNREDFGNKTHNQLKTKLFEENKSENFFKSKNNSFQNKQQRLSSNNTKLKIYGDKRQIVRFQLIARETVIVEFNFYLDVDLMTILKSKEGKFNREERYWVIPYHRYIEIFLAIKNDPKSVNLEIHAISNLPLDFIKNSEYSVLKFIENSKNIQIDYSDDFQYSIDQLPPIFNSKIYNFQREGIAFAIRKHGRILLADEMGVGKTTQAIGIASIYRKQWPVLVICPASIKLNWRNEIVHWLKEIGLTENSIQVLNKATDELKDNISFYITSYEMCWRLEDKIREKKIQFVIADEAHYFKSKESKRTKLMVPILMRCKRVLFLSGTPILAKPLEIYNLLKVLRPDIFKIFHVFSDRYCDPKETKFGIDRSGSSNAKELNFVLSFLMIRRLKKDVLSELPPKRRQKIEIQVDPKKLKQITALCAKSKKLEDLDISILNKKTKKDLNEELLDPIDDSSEPEDELSVYNKAYSLTGEAKIKGICEYIIDLIENRCKFLIFAHHKQILDEIEEVVKKSNEKYIRIDGTTKQEQRQANVDLFQSCDECMIAILSITACATGITLTKASTVVFAEMYFTPAIMTQAEDRAHRIGQEHTCVNIHYLYGPGTLDEIIYKKLQEKHFVVTETLDNKKLLMDIEKLKSGRLGDFEVMIKENSNTQIEENSEGLSQQQIVKIKKVSKNQSKKGTLDNFVVRNDESKYILLKKIEEKNESQFESEKKEIKTKLIENPIKVERDGSADFSDFSDDIGKRKKKK